MSSPDEINLKPAAADGQQQNMTQKWAPDADLQLYSCSLKAEHVRQVHTSCNAAPFCCKMQQQQPDRPWTPVAHLNWSSSASAAAFRVRGARAPASPSRPPELAPPPAPRPSEQLGPSQAELGPAAVLRVRCATSRSAATCRAAALCLLSCLGSRFTCTCAPARSLQSKACQLVDLQGLPVQRQLAARHADTPQCSTSDGHR